MYYMFTPYFTLVSRVTSCLIVFLYRLEASTKISNEKISNMKEDSDVEEMDHESEESEGSNSVTGGESSDTSDSDEASGMNCSLLTLDHW